MKFIFEEENTPRRHQGIIKEGNIKHLFNLILANEGISRIAIADKTGLSRSTVSFLVDDLVRAGIVDILGKGNSDTSGKKPIMLRINEDCAQIAAISLNKTRFNYTLFGLGCNEIESFSKDITYKKGCGAKIWESVVKKSAHLRQDAVLAVCVSIPAQINNIDKSINLSVLNIKNDCNLIAELKSMLPNIPLVVGNQSSAFAYAEYKYSLGENTGDMIFFNLNEGVGAGILFGGTVFTAEIGHMSIDSRGAPCECGKRGCLELYISHDAILKSFNAAKAKKEKNAALSDYKDIRKSLEDENKNVLEIARHIAGEVALGINNVICMFNPKSIVIGGGIEELGAVFLKMVIREIKIPDSGGTLNESAGRLLRERRFQRINVENRIKINYSRLGSGAELKGIVRYFIDHIFTITVEIGNAVYIMN